MSSLFQGRAGPGRGRSGRDAAAPPGAGEEGDARGASLWRCRTRASAPALPGRAEPQGLRARGGGDPSVPAAAGRGTGTGGWHPTPGGCSRESPAWVPCIPRQPGQRSRCRAQSGARLWHRHGRRRDVSGNETFMRAAAAALPREPGPAGAGGGAHAGLQRGSLLRAEAAVWVGGCAGVFRAHRVALLRGVTSSKSFCSSCGSQNTVRI